MIFYIDLAQKNVNSSGLLQMPSQALFKISDINVLHINYVPLDTFFSNIQSAHPKVVRTFILKECLDFFLENSP